MALLAIYHITVQTEDNLVAAFLFIGVQCEQSIRKHSYLAISEKKQEIFASECGTYNTTLTFPAVGAHLKHFVIQLQMSASLICICPGRSGL